MFIHQGAGAVCARVFDPLDCTTGCNNDADCGAGNVGLYVSTVNYCCPGCP
jgi:hypothetical protein